MLTIRQATYLDVKYLLPLLDQLGYPTTQEKLEERFANFVNIDGYGVAVACMEDTIIGLVAWSKSKLFVSDTDRIHIEGLVVDKENRGKNIGQALMMFVEENVKSQNPVIIDLTSGIRRAPEYS